MSETDPSWRAICKRCTGRGFHYLTCPVLRPPEHGATEAASDVV